MDFKDTIVLTTEKFKFLCPKSIIVNVIQAPEKSYASNNEDIKQVTYIHIYFEDYKKLGIKDGYVSPNMDGIVYMKVDEEFKILVGLLRGDKAAEVLFGEKK